MLWASPDFNRRGSERCGPRRTSTGEGLSAVRLPDFNRRKSERCGPRRTSTGEGLSAVGLPDFNRRGSERCGPRRTSTGEGLSAVRLPDFNRRGSECCALAGLQPALSAVRLPDFNRRGSERCGPRRTSTGESLSAVGLAGLQPARFGALWASPDFNRTPTARNKAIKNAKENAR